MIHILNLVKCVLLHVICEATLELIYFQLCIFMTYQLFMILFLIYMLDVVTFVRASI